MTRINTNIASLRGLRNFQKANNFLGQSLERLSTGVKINSGKDNPSGLIASETLRSQISSIEQSIANSNRANNVLATADAALGEIGSLLNQIRGLVQEGLNDGALSQSEIDANQLQIDAALSAINRITANTTFAGDKLIDGSKSFNTTKTAADSAKLSDLQINEALFGSSSTININATINTVASKGELRYAGGALSSAATIEVAGSKGSQVLFFGSSSTVADIESAINNVSDVTGVTATTVDGLTLTGAAQAGSTTQTAAATGRTAELTNGGDTLTLTEVLNADGSAKATSVSIAFVDNTTSDASSSVSNILDDGAGNITIEIEIADNGSGTSLADATDIAAAITGHVGASEFITASGTGTAGAYTSAEDATLAGGLSEGVLTVTDARNGGNGGSAETLGGEISIQFVNNVTGDANNAVSVSNADADGNRVITVELGDDGTNITADLDSIVTSIGLHATANSLVSVAATNGSRLASTSSVQRLEGGHDGDNNDLTFNDLRTGTTANDVRVQLDGSTANQSLSIGYTAVGDGADIVITLATDADGNVTTTAAEVVDLINNGTTSDSIDARAILSVSAEGDGSQTIADSGALQALDTASGTLRLQSSNYGSAEFVEVNVLEGSFSTTLDDGSTAGFRDSGSDVVATINGQSALGQGLAATLKTSTLDTTLTFAESANTGSNTVSVTITGGGSLFQIGQDVSAAGQLGIGLEAVNTARLGGISGKLYELGSAGGRSLNDVSPSKPGSTMVSIIEEAINRVSTMRGRIGALQKNVIETNINTLGVALENISEARSQIMDTDFAEETSNMTKGQILSQAGLSVLSIANQNPAQVLSLLG